MKKSIFTLVLSGLILTASSAFADAPIGTYFDGQAVLNKIDNGGAIDASTGNNYCQVNINGAGVTTANWQKLSVPASDTLHFYFNGTGQTALNKVSTGVSRFAGTVSSNGGTVIFSNPNGILCTGTSVFNMGSATNPGSLLMTTHDVQINDATQSMTLTAQKGSNEYANKYNGIVIEPGAQINLNGNLTIASLGIDMVGAKIGYGNADMVPKNVTLVTSNGLDYYAVPSETKAEGVDESSVSDSSVGINKVNYTTSSKPYWGSDPSINASVKIANTAIKTSDGKIKIISTKDDVKLTANATLNSNYQVADYKEGEFAGDLEIQAKGNVLLSSDTKDTILPFYKDLKITTTDGNIDLVNVRIVDDIEQKTDLSGENITIANFDTNDMTKWNWGNSILGELTANATGDFKADQTQILGNSTIKAGNYIRILGSLMGLTEANETNLKANYRIEIKNSPRNTEDSSGFYPQIAGKLNATATDEILLQNNYGHAKSAPTALLTAKNIKVDNFALKSLKTANTDTITVENVDIKSSEVFGKSEINAKDSVTITNSLFDDAVQINSDGTVNIVAGSTLNSNYEVANKYKGAFLGDLTIDAKGNVTLSSDTKDTILPFYKDLKITTDGDIDLKNVRIVDDVNQLADLSGNNVTVTNFDTKDMTRWNWGNSILGNLNVNAKNDFVADQTQVLGNSTIIANNDLNILGSLFGLTETNETNLTAKNITIKNSPRNTEDSSGFYSQIPGKLTATAQEQILLQNNYGHEKSAPIAFLNAPTVIIDNFALKDTTINNVTNLDISDMNLFGNMVLNLNNPASMRMVDSNITEYVKVNSTESNFYANIFKGDNTNNHLKGYIFLPEETPDSNIDKEAVVYIDSMDPGSAVSANAGAGAFNVKAYAAEDTDDSDYKEEFLRRYVKEDKDGTLYTTQTFKCE